MYTERLVKDMLYALIRAEGALESLGCVGGPTIDLIGDAIRAAHQAIAENTATIGEKDAGRDAEGGTDATAE